MWPKCPCICGLWTRRYSTSRPFACNWEVMLCTTLSQGWRCGLGKRPWVATRSTCILNCGCKKCHNTKVLAWWAYGGARKEKIYCCKPPKRARLFCRKCGFGVVVDLWSINWKSFSKIHMLWICVYKIMTLFSESVIEL